MPPPTPIRRRTRRKRRRTRRDGPPLCAGLSTPHKKLTEGLLFVSNRIQSGRPAVSKNAGSGDPRTTGDARERLLQLHGECHLLVTTEHFDLYGIVAVFVLQGVREELCFGLEVIATVITDDDVVFE